MCFLSFSNSNTNTNADTNTNSNSNTITNTITNTNTTGIIQSLALVARSKQSYSGRGTVTSTVLL